MMLASSMRDAHLFDGGNEPSLLSYDADGDGVVGTPKDLAADANRREELRPALSDAVNRWEATHHTATDSAVVNLGEYDLARHLTYSATWDEAGAPTRSAWTEHPGELNYGRHDSSGLSPGLEDPRLLDDPSFDPIRGEHR